MGLAKKKKKLCKEKANMKEQTNCGKTDMWWYSPWSQYIQRTKWYLLTGTSLLLTSESSITAGTVRIRCMRRQGENRKAVMNSSSSEQKQNGNRGADKNCPRSNSTGHFWMRGQQKQQGPNKPHQQQQWCIGCCYSCQTPGSEEERSKAQRWVSVSQ